MALGLTLKQALESVDAKKLSQEEPLVIRFLLLFCLLIGVATSPMRL